MIQKLKKWVGSSKIREKEKKIELGHISSKSLKCHDYNIPCNTSGRALGWKSQMDEVKD